METVNVIISIISNVGFPIASFCCCAWFIKYTYDASQKLQTEVLNKLTTTVNELSVTVGQLKETINTKFESEE